MGKRYLFFVSVAYSYPILRPLQKEILRRGDEAAWFIEPQCADLLEAGEKRLCSISEVEEYRPMAVFAPGNYIYDFFPGIKVCVFHGFPINKRGDTKDDHFSIRGWFDIYCTQGKTSTEPFRRLEAKYGFFKVYETGWCKADSFAERRNFGRKNERPVIFYSSTFTKSVTSAPALWKTIKSLAETKDWDWILSFHPKFSDVETLDRYRELASTHANVVFHEGGVVDADLLDRADVMLSDSSSVIVEFMMLNKPVVTFRNTMPGPHLVNVQNEDEVERAIEFALARPEELMNAVSDFVHNHEAYLDGKASARVLDAVDDFDTHYKGHLKRKPLNLVRKVKLRLKLGYKPWNLWRSH